MSDFLARLAHKIADAAVAPAEAAGRRLLGTAGLGTVAIAALIAAIAFLSVAIDAWIASFWGTPLAAVCTAGFYLLVVVICLLAMQIRRQAKQSATPVAGSQVPPAERNPGTASIEETIAPFVAILHDTGLRREEVAVRLGAEVAKQLGPAALVATALVAGFILQRSLDGKKQ